VSEFGFSDEILHSIQSILERNECIDKAKIYGSRAKGNYHDRSDIDLAIYGKNIDRFGLAAIQLDFSESDIPLIVDVHHYQGINNALLLEHIDRVGKTIFVNHKGQARENIGCP